VNDVKQINWTAILATGLVLAVILATRTPDISSENINNWFFAKYFLDDLTFVVLPRSPLYQLYLVPFTLLEHPASIIIERGVSTFLCFLPIAALLCNVFDHRIGLVTAVLAAPDLLQVDPAAQAFAFSLPCLALFIRIRRLIPAHSPIACLTRYWFWFGCCARISSWCWPRSLLGTSSSSPAPGVGMRFDAP